MATYIKTLVDNNNDEILPRTRMSAVTNDSGISLQEAFDDKVSYSADTGKTSEQKAQARENIGAGTYSKPAGGIPDSDLAEAHYTESEVDSLLSSKADKRTVKTAMDAVAVAETDYFLGTQTAVSVVLPASASAGQSISVVFYSGSTAATLSVTGTTIGSIPTPTTNQRVELNSLWDGSYWAILSNTMAVTV